jgi:hypothetical protein
MHKLLSLFISSLLAATTLVAISSPQAFAAATLTTCTNLETGKTLVLRSADAQCRSHLGSALWHIEQPDSTAHSGAGYASITVCSAKNPLFNYRLIKDSCPKFLVSTSYWRTVAAPTTPIIEAASARGYDSAAFALAATTQNKDALIAYYLITNIQSGQLNKVFLNNSGQLLLSNLSSLTSYTFTIAAVSVDGTSLPSSISPVITTGAAPIVVVASTAAALAAPAFTLSSSAETKTVNTAATGFTISSTGGAIASFAINATPAGMSFSTSTGALTGTPNTVASATAYTITATNATGSATRIFTLTVAAVIVYTVGQTGPGGGTIFYVATTPFVCGPARAAMCNYLEAAPSGWNTGSDPARRWADSTYQSTTINNPTSPETATATAIGWGYWNTRAIVLQGNTNTATSAAALADSHTVTVSGVVYDDWYLPSKDELNQMCKWVRGVAWTSDATVCTSGTINTGSGAADFVAGGYWSSSEYSSVFVWLQGFQDGVQYGGNIYKNQIFYIRPVRAF